MDVITLSEGLYMDYFRNSMDPVRDACEIVEASVTEAAAAGMRWPSSSPRHVGVPGRSTGGRYADTMHISGQSRGGLCCRTIRTPSMVLLEV